MSLQVTLAVLGSALAHALWNALIKRGRDPLLETALLNAWSGLIGLALIPFVALPGAQVVPLLLASVAVHCAYNAALAAAYRHGDLSLAYPIMRGSAPLFTAIVAGIVLGEWPRLPGWLGVVAISAGVLAIGLARGLPSATGHRGKALGWALLTASTIVAYTVVDSIGVRSAPNAWSYVIWLAALEGIVVFSLMYLARRRELIVYARERGLTPLGVGMAAMLAYGIALWAMTQAPVALVAALRESSVLFAMLLGAMMLKEHLGAMRWAGAISIVAGVVALRLG